MTLAKMHEKVAERYFAYGRSNSEISISENWLDIFVVTSLHQKS